MSALTKKLFRTIQNSKGSFFAVVAVVMVGVSVYIAMTTAFYNLNHSKDIFYKESNFADYFFHVVKAPQEIIKQIEALPEVVKATGRIQIDIPAIKENKERATLRLYSYPLPMDNEINRLHILTGRLFQKKVHNDDIEVLLDSQYVNANNLNIGNKITVIADGKTVDLKLVGTATSPEFIYPMKDAASLMPEPDKFGIVMIPQDQAQQMLNLSGQVNQISITLVPGVDKERVAQKVKDILEPYGNLANYSRDNQLSHAVLQAELDGLKATSKSLPVIFLVVAAAIQFVMLSRIVKNQRLQIGVMKALGYSNWQIILHYNGFAVMVAFIGALLGSLLGLLFAVIISQTYAQYFNLPEAISGVNYKAILDGFVLSFGVGVTAGLIATRSVTAINPAESMRPEPPKKGGKTFFEKWPWIWNKLSSQWKMSLRSIGRNKVRFVITLLGVLFAVALLVNALFANDSLDYMLKKHFTEEQSYDYLIRFANPVKESEILNITRIDGVLRAEALLEIPVKVKFNNRSEDDLFVGLPKAITLKNLYNDEGKLVQLPDEGILINERIANKLGVRIGDIIEIETQMGLGPKHTTQMKVMGINQQVIGSSSFLEIDQANKLLKEKRVVSGVMLKVDKGSADQIEKELNKMTRISSILSRDKEFENFNQNLDSMIYFTMVMIIFAVILGFAIVYNVSIISFIERERELAALRVIGFTKQEVSKLLLKENLLQSLLGVALGLPFGNIMAREYVKAINNDLYSMPVVVYPKTYLFAGIGGVLFILLAHFTAVRGIKNLDLVAVLKNKD